MYLTNIVRKLWIITILGIAASSLYSWTAVSEKVLTDYMKIPSQDPIDASNLDLRGASFSGKAKLNLQGGSLQNLAAESCSYPAPTFFLQCDAHQQATDFSGSILQGINFKNSNFTNAILKGVDFTGSDFTKATFLNADLSNSILTGIKVNWTDFTGANFTGAQGLDTMQDTDPNSDGGDLFFCNATMPDGTVCSSGTVWTAKSGKQIDCNCPSSDSSSSSSSGS